MTERTSKYDEFIAIVRPLMQAGTSERKLGLMMGYSDGAIAHWRQKGAVPAVAMLAARYVAAQHAPAADQHFTLMRCAAGNLEIVGQMQGAPDEIKLGGQMFLLIPVQR